MKKNKTDDATEDKPKRPVLTLADLWTWYRVRFTFLTQVCASVPADPEVIAAWLAVREPRVKPPGGRSIQEINEEVLASIAKGEGEPDEAFSMLVFQRHQGAVCVRASTVRSHLKDCARIISAQFIGYIQGERSFSTRVINGVYHDERRYWLPLTRDDQPLTEPDDERDKPIHVRGARGEPLNALKRFEYIEPPVEFEVTLKVLGRSVSETDLNFLLSYGGTHGYGGERGDGEGRYSYTLTRIDAPGERAALAHSGSHRGEA